MNLKIHGLCPYVVCTTCKMGFQHKEVKAHLSQQHPRLYPLFQQDKFNALMAEKKWDSDDGVLPDPPVMEEEGMYIPGMALYQGYGCPSCEVSGRSTQYLTKHWYKAHPGQRQPREWPQFYIQRWNDLPGPNRQWFRVELPETALSTPQTSADPSTEALNTLWAKLDALQPLPSEDLDSRKVSPWLLKTGWHIHTEGYDAQKLRELVLLPKDAELPALKSAVKEYMQSSLDLIKSTDVLVLQKLNTDDPMKE